MWRLLRYYGKVQGVRGNLTGLPRPALWILLIFALPGLILLGLSLVAVAVSILALLLLTMPVYRLLSLLTGKQTAPEELRPDRVVRLGPDEYEVSAGPDEGAGKVNSDSGELTPRRARLIDVKIVD